MLRRLVQPSRTRARLFSATGELVADSRFLIDCGASALVAMNRCGVDPNSIDMNNAHGKSPKSRTALTTIILYIMSLSIFSRVQSQIWIYEDQYNSFYLNNPILNAPNVTVTRQGILPVCCLAASGKDTATFGP